MNSRILEGECTNIEGATHHEFWWARDARSARLSRVREDCERLASADGGQCWRLCGYFSPSPVAWPIVLLPPVGPPTLGRLSAMLRGRLCKLDALTLCT